MRRLGTILFAVGFVCVLTGAILAIVDRNLLLFLEACVLMVFCVVGGTFARR